MQTIYCSGSTRAHFSTLDSARRRRGGAWIQPVAFSRAAEWEECFTHCYTQEYNSSCSTCGIGCFIFGALGLGIFSPFPTKSGIGRRAAWWAFHSTNRADQRGVGADERPSIYKDAGGKCLETEMTRFVKKHSNSCQIFAQRGKCRMKTVWILSTISEISPDHDILIQVRLSFSGGADQEGTGMWLLSLKPTGGIQHELSG